MDKPMPEIMFIGMSFVLKCRDIFRPRENILREVDIKPNSKVLDFGYGPGSYITHVSKTVGENGKVYALDIHPLAVKKVNDIVSRLGLSNVETICSDCSTGLPDDEGILSFSDHHIKEKDILSAKCKTK